MKQILSVFACVVISNHAFISQRPPTQSHWKLFAALDGLNVAVVGGGPAGLLLTHQLAQNGASVQVFEARSRPSEVKSGKAYALGVGLRGRTAIREGVDEDLWQAVRSKGFSSERFRLHVGPLALKLRDGSENQEPSLLLFQSDLCKAMADELDERFHNVSSVSLNFGTPVSDIDLSASTIRTSNGSLYSYDLVVGCDGVNSVVRKSLKEQCEAFESTTTKLPGLFKTIQITAVPSGLDATAVSLVIPKSGSTTAFVEPTADSCCVLFAGSNATDPLLTSDETDVIASELESRFPLLEGMDWQVAAQQLASVGRASQASSVKCNTYNAGGSVVLCGDAAHATGGVSGQGVNSALRDTVVLTNALLSGMSQAKDNKEGISQAIQAYSMEQVPEGHALYDLSFPPKATNRLDGLIRNLNNALSFVWRGRWGIGRPPLQTQLTTSIESFSQIRRSRQKLFYGQDMFPTDEDWHERLLELDQKCQSFRAPVTMEN